MTSCLVNHEHFHHAMAGPKSWLTAQLLLQMCSGHKTYFESKEWTVHKITKHGSKKLPSTLQSRKTDEDTFHIHLLISSNPMNTTFRQSLYRMMSFLQLLRLNCQDRLLVFPEAIQSVLEWIHLVVFHVQVFHCYLAEHQTLSFDDNSTENEDWPFPHEYGIPSESMARQWWGPAVIAIILRCSKTLITFGTGIGSYLSFTEAKQSRSVDDDGFVETLSCIVLMLWSISHDSMLRIASCKDQAIT